MQFAMTGAAGYVAPRHLKAIKETGNRLVMALDPSESVGMVGSYFPQAVYFNSPEEFELRLKRLDDQSKESKIDYVSICSPTHLHDAQIRTALKYGTHAICEKPIVVNPSDLEHLEEIENRSGRVIYAILQLRSHDLLKQLRQELCGSTISSRSSVVATYITGRGLWYRNSWKADEEKSGGLAMNIGVHLFDLLIWLFGKVERTELHLSTSQRMAGALEMEHASVRWYLSIDSDDLPASSRAASQRVFRSIVVDGSEFTFTNGLDNLHTRVYESILDGHGLRIEDAKPSIELVHSIRHSTISNGHGNRHPILSF